MLKKYPNEPPISKKCFKEYCKQTKTLKEISEEVTPHKIKQQTLEHNINEHQQLLNNNPKLRKHRAIISELITNCLNDIIKETKKETPEIKELEKQYKTLSILTDINHKLTKTAINSNVRINELNIIINNLNKELHPESNRNGLKSLAESIRDSLKMLDTEETIT